MLTDVDDRIREKGRPGKGVAIYVALIHEQPHDIKHRSLDKMALAGDPFLLVKSSLGSTMLQDMEASWGAWV